MGRGVEGGMSESAELSYWILKECQPWESEGN